MKQRRAGRSGRPRSTWSSYCQPLRFYLNSSLRSVIHSAVEYQLVSVDDDLLLSVCLRGLGRRRRGPLLLFHEEVLQERGESSLYLALEWPRTFP